MSNEHRERYHRIGKARIEKRSSEALLGLCMGMLADNQLNDDEITFLQCWIEDHQEIATQFPGDILLSNIQEALGDGFISDDERNHLVGIVKSIIGGTLQESGATSGLSTSLPINHDIEVTMSGKNFCFTGQLKHGNRKSCEQTTREGGGIIEKRIVQKLNYLVLGSVATTSWVNTSFGRKIEKAVLYQKDGFDLHIVSEEQWKNAFA